MTATPSPFARLGRLFSPRQYADWPPALTVSQRPCRRPRFCPGNRADDRAYPRAHLIEILEEVGVGAR